MTALQAMLFAIGVITWTAAIIIAIINIGPGL